MTGKLERPESQNDRKAGTTEKTKKAGTTRKSGTAQMIAEPPY